MKPTIKVQTEFGTFKRQTARKYLYFVISTGRSAVSIREQYARQFEQNMKESAACQVVVDAMVKAGAKFAHQIDGNNYNEQVLIRTGGAKKGQIFFAQEKPEGWDGCGYHSLADWQKWSQQPSLKSYQDRAAEEITKEKTRGYRDVQWSTRLGLAQKYADDLRKYNHEDVKIIEIATGKAVL